MGPKGKRRQNVQGFAIEGRNEFTVDEESAVARKGKARCDSLVIISYLGVHRMTVRRKDDWKDGDERLEGGRRHNVVGVEGQVGNRARHG